MDQRRWRVRAVAIPAALLVLSFVGCARRPWATQVSGPSPMGSAGASAGSWDNSGGGDAGMADNGGTAKGGVGNDTTQGGEGAAGQGNGAGGSQRSGTASRRGGGTPSINGGNDSALRGGGTSSGNGGSWEGDGTPSTNPGSDSALIGGGTSSGSGGSWEGDGSGTAGGLRGRDGAMHADTTGAPGGDAATQDATQSGMMIAAARPNPTEFPEAPGLPDIHFDFDRYEIRSEEAKTLDANAEWLRSNPNALLLIEGHCDERGTNEYNIALGEHRAKSAMNYLIGQGIKAGRITIISYGEERPLCAEHTEACWAENRRGHFLVKSR